MADKKILAEGAEAYRQGQAMTANPYDQRIDKDKHNYWLSGWLDEQYYWEFEMEYFDYER